MKNSGLFLNMAKWCFLGLFFEVLMLLWFVFGVFGIVPGVLKLACSSQFLGLLWGGLFLFTLGLEGLGVFVFLVFVLFCVAFVSALFALFCFVVGLFLVLVLGLLLFLFFFLFFFLVFFCFCFSCFLEGLRVR